MASSARLNLERTRHRLSAEADKIQKVIVEGRRFALPLSPPATPIEPGIEIYVEI